MKIDLALFIFGILFLGSCTDKEEAAPEEIVKYVKVEQIHNGYTNGQLSFNGKVEEKSMTLLSLRVGGTLQKLPVKEGDYVRAGQLIAMLDKRDYQLQVDTRKVQYEQAKAEYERYKTLMDKSKIPANTFEQIESGYLLSKKAYDNALNQLKDTELRSPVSGYVHEKFLENFQSVGPGQPIVSIIDRSELEVVINVPEDRVLALKKTPLSKVSVRKAEVYDIPVKLSNISNKASEDGLYEVRYSFTNKGNQNILPGMTATLEVLLPNEKGVIQIPGSAVFHEKESDYVWVYDTDQQAVMKRSVELADLRSGGKVEVKKGLQHGEHVITAGVHSISEGQKVKPIQPKSRTNVGDVL